MLSDIIKKNILISESHGIDHTMIICFVALLSIGLIMITSATLDYALDMRSNPYYFITKHLIYLSMGLILAAIISKIKLSFYYDYGKYFLLLSFIISLIIFIPGLGKEINGAKRWLDLGFITIQVSEVSRLFIMFWISGFIVKHDVNKSFNKCLFMIVILSLIILYQRDFGSTVLLVFTFFSLMLVAGLHLRYLLSYLSLAVLAAIPLILYQPYRLKRIVSFMNPWDDQSGGGYQLIASLLAFGKGGFFGLGLGSSVQKLNYLPESYNDFIFALIAEELGLFFSLIILILFSIIFFRIIRLANISSDNNLRFASYLCFTLGFFITYQALIHIMVNTGLAPTKGMGLPFISYGGTNLLMMFIFIGLLIRIQIENRQKISHAVKRGF
ncbi:MAG: putative lipid II flippase FtsW [Gammaproteobacteria bacterium]|nr:putative lipid II flippase FtsW [Gammaproteobacteria bacterium]MBT5863540.1 putative lipid II flippase FtsW [Gammaproteobacteria bacterium]MBT6734623.1 putative lipid II flippase FtsW [Gammaproteobacteria bacterium]